MKRVLLFAAATSFAVNSAGVGATAWAGEWRDSASVDEFAAHLFQMVAQESPQDDGQGPKEPGDGQGDKDGQDGQDGKGQTDGQGDKDGQGKIPPGQGCEPGQGKDCGKGGDGGQGHGGKIPGQGCEPGQGKDCGKGGDGGQGQGGKIPGQGCEPGQGKDCGKGGDGGQGHGGKIPGQGCEPGQGQGCEPGQGQGCEPGQGQGDAGQCEPGQSLHGYRIDCRFHSNPQVSGVRFCVASVMYRKYGKQLDDFRLGVGCDYETLYSGPAEFHPQAIADRISPTAAVFPTLEIPSDALLTGGTYQSILDTFAGRLTGTCYVRPASY